MDMGVKQLGTTNQDDSKGKGLSW